MPADPEVEYRLSEWKKATEAYKNSRSLKNKFALLNAKAALWHAAGWGDHQADDGTNGQDRESYSDTQDRENYTVDPEREDEDD